VVKVESASFDAAANTLALTLSQTCAASPGTNSKLNQLTLTKPRLALKLSQTCAASALPPGTNSKLNQLTLTKHAGADALADVRRVARHEL
jgi:hypothetical protein